MNPTAASAAPQPTLPAPAAGPAGLPQNPLPGGQAELAAVAVLGYN